MGWGSGWGSSAWGSAATDPAPESVVGPRLSAAPPPAPLRLGDAGDDVSPETCLRVMDQAMMDWVGSLRVGGRKPAAIPGWQSRYFASAQELHDDLDPKQQIPLPAVALLSLGLSPDPSRWVRGDVRRLGPGAPSKQNTLFERTDGGPSPSVLHLPWPYPVNLSYQVELWTRRQQDMRVLRTAILMRFADLHPEEAMLRVDFPAPYGRKALPLRFEGDTDNSDLEAGDRERRLRRSLTFTLSGWLFRVPVRRRTIGSAHVVVADVAEHEAQAASWYGDVGNYTFSLDGTVLESVAEFEGATPPNRVLLTMSFAAGAQTGIGGM